MKQVKSFTGEYYKDNTRIEKFFLYKIIYPIVNKIGLNRKFNLWLHKIGMYSELSNGRCNWCGEDHRIIPLRNYKEKSMLDRLQDINNKE